MRAEQSKPMDELFNIVSQMKTETALTEIAKALKRLLSDLDSKSRERYLMNLIEQSKGDKITGMVHL
ncbi:MAG TPA: hypothetical protein VKO20_07675 [Desulfosalsimonadaceae bacterium]|nr:hypothetical protein [Desulfosalsimonadaceae bacterium]